MTLLKTGQRPNLRRSPLDLYSLEQQVGGIEPGEYLNLKAKRFARSRREQIGMTFLVIGIGLLSAVWLYCVWLVISAMVWGES